MATIKQKRAVNNLVGNGGNVTKAMRDAKYKEGTIHTPQKLTESKGFQEVAKPFLDELMTERNRLMKAIKTKRLTQIQYESMIRSMDTITKNIQLLGGKPTENFNFLSDDQFSKLIQRARKATDSK